MFLSHSIQRLPVSIAVLGLACSLPIAANADQPRLVELPPFPVEAHPAGTDETTSSLSLAEVSADIFAPLDLRDHFAAVPNAHLDQPGGPGGRTTLFLRGSEENHTLIFLDGVPLNDPTNTRGGAVDLSLLAPSVVGQIAVLRGPASVRYGPEALGGVVHLETNQSGVRPRQLLAAVGEQDFHRVQLGWQETVATRSSVSLLAASDADGEEADGGRHERQFVRGSWQWDGPVAVTASAWYANLESWSFPDESGGQRYAVIRDLEERSQDAVGGSLRLGRDMGDLKISVTADASHFENQTRSPGVVPGARDPMGLPASIEKTNFHRSRAQLLIENPMGSLAWSGGIDGQHESGKTRGSLFYGPMEMPADFDLTRDRIGVFGEFTAQLPADLRMTFGARVDRFSGESWRATFRAGVRGMVGSSTEWRVNAGNAFKPASFYALSNPLVGNSELRPATSETIEAGLRQALNRRGDFIDVTVFSSRATDDIDFDPGPPPSLVNRDAIRRNGAEIGLGWQALESLSLIGSIGYVDARVKPSDERLRGRPDWRASLRADWRPVERLVLSLAVVTVDQIEDTSIPTGAMMLGGWTRLDFAAEWALTPQLDLMAALDNALDREYEEAVGFSARERRVRLGLRATF